MAKNRYTDEEKRAVFNAFFKDTPLKYEDLKAPAIEKLMDTFNGACIVASMRLRKAFEALPTVADFVNSFKKGFKNGTKQKK